MKFIYELTRSTAKKKALRGGNEMISSNDRLDPHSKAELTAYLRKLSTERANEQHDMSAHTAFSEANPCYMIITVYPPTARRMDSPNWYPTVKALIDGLTDAGVFEDDNNNVITGYLFLTGPKTDDGKYRFELDIREGDARKWQI